MLIFQPGLIQRDLGLLGLNAQDDYFKQIVLSAAEQSTIEANLVDSIELYHLAGSPDKVIETVNKALGSSLALPTAAPVINQGQGLGISGAFGGTQDLFGLAKRVHAVYEADYASRNRIGRGNWEVLGVLLKLKEALEQYSADRPDLAYEVGVVRVHGVGCPTDYSDLPLDQHSPS
jgi:nuclear pore complex protein Nup93